MRKELEALNFTVDSGVAYFSSAGNQSRRSYEAEFDPSGRPIFFGTSGLGEAHDFDPGSGVDIFQQVTIPPRATLIVSFQWDSPFFSVSEGKGAVNDLDIFVWNAAQTSILAGSIAPNIGGDPVEVLFFTNPNNLSTAYNLMITNYSGPNPGLLKYVIFWLNKCSRNAGKF